MAGGGPRTYTPGSPADEKAQYLKQQAEKYRSAWRLAWDFPEPETEARTPEEQADRWLAELDRYGISRVGFATGGGNDTLASVLPATLTASSASHITTCGGRIRPKSWSGPSPSLG